MKTYEVNFDGLIGPNHNYSGLAFGNLASERNAKNISHPKQAALQGLKKMRKLVNLGYKQGILLPHQRPNLHFARKLGFSGPDKQLITKIANTAPNLLTTIYSASSMWAANAATVTPSMDSTDGKLHLTPANLHTTLHRSIEHEFTKQCLASIFNSKHHFSIHDALPSHHAYADEGAANHTRLCREYSEQGIALFVYGRSNADTTFEQRKFPARQSLEASQSIAQQHKIQTNRAVFLRQNHQAIEAGAFHNDVVAVGNGPALFFHELAFEPKDQTRAFQQISEHMEFKPICVPDARVSLQDAVDSYLFNSQLLAPPSGDMDSMCLIAPTECQENERVNHYLAEMTEDTNNLIQAVEFVDVRQSMSNGGGPACLRLRVVMTEEEVKATNQEFLLDNEKLDTLEKWVNKHYRDNLSPADLADPSFLTECYHALDDLTTILNLGAYYDFQK